MEQKIGLILSSIDRIVSYCGRGGTNIGWASAPSHLRSSFEDRARLRARRDELRSIIRRILRAARRLTNRPKRFALARPSIPAAPKWSPKPKPATRKTLAISRRGAGVARFAVPADSPKLFVIGSLKGEEDEEAELDSPRRFPKSLWGWYNSERSLAGAS